jgi:hypothetical protein
MKDCVCDNSNILKCKCPSEYLISFVERLLLHSKNSRSIKLPTERRILLQNYAGNYVCYGENYT